MSLRDLFLLVLGNLNRMRLRSALTTVGVVIGTAAIVLMVAIGVGLQTFVTTEIEDVISASQIIVFPGEAGENPGGGPPGLTRSATEQKLDQKAIQEIENIPEVKRVEPQLTLNTSDVYYRNFKVRSTSVQGLSDYSVKELELAEGRIFKPTEKKVAIVGNKLGHAIFQEEKEEPINNIDLLGKNLRVVLKRQLPSGEIEEKTVRLRIIGIAEASGAERDFQLYLPLEAIQEYIEFTLGISNLTKTRGYDMLIVEAESINKVDQVEQKLTEKNYNSFALKTFISGLQTVFTVIQAILGGVGAIALLVAAIGIVNTMVMSIYERTREIGIMKAIGASNREIMKIFLLEAGTIGIFGGIGGIVLSYLMKLLINFGLGFYLKSIGTDPINAIIIPIWLLFFSIGFAFLVGLIAGVYPARRAARLSPLNALRYE